ncbi:hypothetical protein LJR225_000070 [Phenylobacterium sp. LjRoot225]|uniref:hypothetical protein n=1 Tax=Phenylobacterium sp. LjRoot225 TaxID=3342285 RepID=UPI003ECE18FF
MAVAALAAFALAAASARAEDAAPARVYVGTVGAAAVVMQLEPDAQRVSGAYFYRRARLDIGLDGSDRDGVLELSADTTGDKLSLRPSGPGYVGVLTTAKGRTLPVALRVAAPGAASRLPANAPATPDLYERLRLSGLSLRPQKVQKIGRRTIRWYVEPLSGLSLFRIERGYAPAAMAEMNRAMAREQWDYVRDYFACPGADGGPGVESAAATDVYLSDAHVSYAWRSAWSCARAAHPDFGMMGRAFDARTGRELSLDDVLKFWPAPAPKADTEAWYDYRTKVFAPGLVTLLARFHPAEMAPPTEGEDCDYSDPQVWNFPAWRMTAKGLYVGAYFPRVARSCDTPDWSVIPYSGLPELR